MDNVEPSLSVSLVTTCLNQVDVIGAALRSVLDQGFPGLEYIVIDGGSEDGSVDVIEAFSDRLAYWVSEPDRGHYQALNKGFAKSSGEIMGFLNGDDVLLSGSLSLVAHIFRTFPEIDWLTGAHVGIDPAGRPAEMTRAGRWTRWHLLSPSSGRMVPQESTFWRRSLWEASGGALDEEFSLAADFDLWVRFSRNTQLHTVYAPIGCFRFTAYQRSVHQREAYLAQVNAIRRRELRESLRVRTGRALASTLFWLQKVLTLQSGIGSGRLRSLVDSLLGAPPAIYFDQANHQFVRAGPLLRRHRRGANTG